MEVKKKKLSPFDIVNYLNTKTGLDYEEVEDAYNAWMINAALSNHQQTVMFANEMNKNYSIPKEQQLAFHFNGIPKGKRFGKWHTKETSFSSDDIEIVSSLFCINNKTAEQYLSLLNDEQLTTIRKVRGGNNGKSSGSTN